MILKVKVKVQNEQKLKLLKVFVSPMVDLEVGCVCVCLLQSQVVINPIELNKLPSEQQWLYGLRYETASKACRP